MIKEFVNFLLKRVYRPIEIEESLIESALNKTIDDIQFHFPNSHRDEIIRNITTNSNELAVFLFRLGNKMHIIKEDEKKFQIHWLLKEICSCEIYFNNTIDTGFYIVHGQGTVIGSRNIIGKGFKIHHGCTIGHKKNGIGKGNIIGDNVTMYANSSIIGELNIGNNVIIGGHVFVTEDIPNNQLVTNKNKLFSKDI